MSNNFYNNNSKSLFPGLNRESYSFIVFCFTLAAAILLSYGYEIFNLNLTIDEEIHGNQGGKWREWIAQGRWGMGLLNFFLLPYPVAPAVSILLGIVGTTLGIIIFLKYTYEINWIGVLGITTLTITTPTLPFTFTFSTLAYGIGFAFLALSVSNLMVGMKSWRYVLFASLLAAFAISVYQTFVFVLAMFVLVHIWRHRAEQNANIFLLYKYLAVYFFGSIFIYFLINSIALIAASIDVKYVGQFIDLKGFIQSPFQKAIAAVDRLVDVFNLSPTLFGIRSIWLGIVMLVAVLFSFSYPLINRRYDRLLNIGAIVIGVLMVMVFADSISRGGAPLRSVVYIPVGIAIIVASAFTVTGDVGKRILISLCCLAVIGNSLVNNHLFASSASAEFRDKMLAENIIDEVRKLNHGKTDYSALKVEVIGNRMWPVTGIQSKTETFGASFFEWDGGNRHRVAAYLNLNGLTAIGATEEERVHVYNQEKAIPAWPNSGWVTLAGDILVLKFGEYSIPQKASLCTQGVVSLCD